MKKPLFILVDEKSGDDLVRASIRRYYAKRHHNVEFLDTVQFEHLENFNIEYAKHLCPVGLIEYAKQFAIELDPRRMFSSNIKILADSIDSENKENLVDSENEEKLENNNEKDSDDSSETTEENKVIEEETKSTNTESEANDNVPADLICPHCSAKARTSESFIKNHGDNCSRKLD